MLNRLYFSRTLTVIVKERRNVFPSRGNFQFTRTFMRKSEQNVLYTNTWPWTSCSNGLFPKTKLLVRFQSVPLVARLRFYQRDSTSTNKSWKGWLWNIARGVFMVTGGLVWLVAFTAYMALDRVTVDVLENDNNASTNTLQKKLAEHFYHEKIEARILGKEKALGAVWQKLRQEERIKDIFGEPVFICGYNYKVMSHIQGFVEHLSKAESDVSSQKEDDKKTKEQVNVENDRQEDDIEGEEDCMWEAGCYIEGPKKMGVMNVKFEKLKQEWVPVSLHLETAEKTGHVISDVSGSLPNGIKNFTRLSN